QLLQHNVQSPAHADRHQQSRCLTLANSLHGDLFHKLSLIQASNTHAVGCPAVLTEIDSTERARQIKQRSRHWNDDPRNASELQEREQAVAKILAIIPVIKRSRRLDLLVCLTARNGGGEVVKGSDTLLNRPDQFHLLN